MLETHAPHEPIHTWKGFFIHLATIVIGLFIAVGLEQIVEFFHHRHQRLQLEQQVLEVLERNTHIVDSDLKQLSSFRDYLVELKTAIAARRHGQSSPAAPASGDPRMALTLLTTPGLAPYEAAKQNGSIALLASERIRLYYRISLQRDFMSIALGRWLAGIAALQEFQERFVDAKGLLDFGDTVNTPDLALLMPAEFVEYQALVAALVKQTDVLSATLFMFDAEGRAALGGARNEVELLDAIRPWLKARSDANSVLASH
jgi:hypothetical protein